MPITTAMILAAGRGNRLRPLTDSVPKPLIHVGRYRLIEYHLMSLASIGIRRVVINVSHLADLIQTTLGDGSHYGVDIIYSPEPDGALETAGGIQHALAMLGHEPFLVVNGDVLCDLKLDSLALATPDLMHLVLVPNPPHHPQGDFRLDSLLTPHRLLAPSPTGGNMTYAGIGVFHPIAFQSLKPGRCALAPLIRDCIANKQASCVPFHGYWMDVGDSVRLNCARRESHRLESLFQ